MGCVYVWISDADKDRQSAVQCSAASSLARRQVKTTPIESGPAGPHAESSCATINPPAVSAPSTLSGHGSLPPFLLGAALRHHLPDSRVELGRNDRGRTRLGLLS